MPVLKVKFFITFHISNFIAYRLNPTQAQPILVYQVVSIHLLKKLTLMPSILNPRVAEELSLSLHCMYLGLVIDLALFSLSVGSVGSTSTIF